MAKIQTLSHICVKYSIQIISDIYHYQHVTCHSFSLRMIHSPALSVAAKYSWVAGSGHLNRIITVQPDRAGGEELV